MKRSASSRVRIAAFSITIEPMSGESYLAQRLSQQAWEKIAAAQQANEWDMQGHAAKAKELLDQVNQELKLSAEAANKNHK